LHDNHPLIFNTYYDIRNIIKSNNLKLEEKIVQLKQIEEVIIEDQVDKDFYNNVENIEGVKNGLLVALAISRYSLYLWSPKSENGLGYYDLINNNPSVVCGPPDWVLDDIWGAATSALFTWNPFGALGGGIASSAVSALRGAIE
jgi:WD40 repeat protein